MKYVPFVIVLIVLGVGTFIEGNFSERWGKTQSKKLDEFTARLDAVPMTIGDWQGRNDEINEEEFKASNCSGCVSRSYVNREGQCVNVYLVSGNSRHVTIHTPDWCYVGAGYVMDEEPNQRTMQEVDQLNPRPEFLTTTFHKEDALQTHRIRIYWSFTDDGVWRGPKMPKPAFAGKSAMYKVYLITELSGVNADPNVPIDFAKVFLPELDRVLFAKETPAS